MKNIIFNSFLNATEKNTEEHPKIHVFKKLLFYI